MFTDFGIVIPIIVGGFAGFRDGSVRKLVSIVVTFGAMFVAKYFMPDLAGVMQKQLGTDPSWASLHAYLIVFFCILVLQSLLYRFLTGNYKIGGAADRIGGVVLGVVQTSLVISVILTVFAMKGIPSEGVIKESRSYESVRTVAMRLLNLVTESGVKATETIEKLKDEGVSAVSGDTTKSVGDKLRDMIDKDIQEQVRDAQKIMPSAQDSIRKSQKKQ